jgi:hypothetical protein
MQLLKHQLDFWIASTKATTKYSICKYTRIKAHNLLNDAWREKNLQ